MRVFISIVGFLSALFGVPWLTALCILMLAVRYPAWEVIVLGLCVDFLWLPSASAFAVPYFTIGSLALVWLLEPLRMQFLR